MSNDKVFHPSLPEDFTVEDAFDYEQFMLDPEDNLFDDDCGA